jgi:hypothetical protein
MKVIRFSVSEKQFTHLKSNIGFDNLEDFFCPVIDKDIERSEKFYGATTK